MRKTPRPDRARFSALRVGAHPAEVTHNGVSVVAIVTDAKGRWLAPVCREPDKAIAPPGLSLMQPW
jgi:hypothetical protein